MRIQSQYTRVFIFGNENIIKTFVKPPVAQKPYPIPYAYKEEVLKELRKLLESGLIEPSISAWACPILVRLKKDSKPDDIKLKIICDFKRLNQVTLPDAASLGMKSWMASVAANGMQEFAMPPEGSTNIPSTPLTGTRRPWCYPLLLEGPRFNGELLPMDSLETPPVILEE